LTDSDLPAGVLPDSAWFQQLAGNAGLAFFIIRVRPDVAFEFVTPGILTESVHPRPDSSPAATQEFLERVHPDSAGDLAAALSMLPGQTRWIDVKWRLEDGHLLHSWGWVRYRLLAENAWDVIWTGRSPT
jgi:hypothetical protein